MTALRLPNGVSTHYSYDAAGRLVTVVHQRDSNLLARYTYTLDGMGHRTHLTETLRNPQDISVTRSITHTYDPAGRLTALTHTHNGALLARHAYTLDATGNRTHVTETVNGVTREISYTYDPLYRLTAADYSTGEAYAYQYDSDGNREVMTDAIGVHTYTYDAANRLTNADGVVHTWDNRGNLLADGTFTYTYSAAGRMEPV